jgi:hypothetical protein
MNEGSPHSYSHKSVHKQPTSTKGSIGGIKRGPNRITLAKHFNHSVPHATNLNRELLRGAKTAWTSLRITDKRDGDLDDIPLSLEGLMSEGWVKFRSNVE